MKNLNQDPMRSKDAHKWLGGCKKAFKSGLHRLLRHKARIEAKKLPEQE